MPRPRVLIEVNCKYCGIQFQKMKCEYDKNIRAGKEFYCSRLHIIEALAQEKRKNTPTEEEIKTRFLKYVDIPQDKEKCWIWTGAASAGGYGRFSFYRSSWPAGAIALRLFKGIVYERYKGILVCHKCDNSKCVNPEHLFLGTHKENMQDVVNKLRRAGEANPRSKLSETDINNIRSLYLAKENTKKTLAKKFEISESTVKRIVQGKSWRCLTDGLKVTKRKYNSVPEVNKINGRNNNRKASDKKDRFLRYVRIESNGCWTWLGCHNREGYGLFYWDKECKGKMATWAALELFKDMIIPHNEGWQVCHCCDNPPCVNPDHLFIGAVSDNMLDRASKGRACKAGAVLAEHQVMEIKRGYANGNLTLSDLALKFKVRLETIHRIVNNKTWKHVIV